MSDAESSKSSSEVGLSGFALTSGDDDSSLSEGPDCSFIFPDDWEVNKHCSSLSAKRLLKIQTEFQIPHNVATRLAKVGEKCYSHDGESVALYEASFTCGWRLPLNYLTRMLL